MIWILRVDFETILKMSLRSDNRTFLLPADIQFQSRGDHFNARDC